MSFIWDMVSELLNFVVSSVKTMFSLDTRENYGRVQDNSRPGSPAGPVGGVGRAPVSTAPSANDVVADLLRTPIDVFDSVATVVTGDHGNVQFIKNVEEWQTKVNEAKATGKVIVAKFFATWCGPCKMIGPVFVELSKKFGNQPAFLKIDVEEVSDVAVIYEVRSMPTFIFVRDGQQIDKIIGAKKEVLEMKCNQYATG